MKIKFNAEEAFTSQTAVEIRMTLPEWNRICAGINNSVPYRQVSGQDIEKNNNDSAAKFEAVIDFRDAVQREVWRDQLDPKPAIARSQVRSIDQGTRGTSTLACDMRDSEFKEADEKARRS